MYQVVVLERRKKKRERKWQTHAEELANAILGTLTRDGAYKTGKYQAHPRFYIKTTEQHIQADVKNAEEQGKWTGAKKDQIDDDDDEESDS